MLVLDENLPDPERELLSAWRIRVRQLGVDLARKGTSDENVLPLLHELRGVTFFTRDVDYYRRDWCHARYCLVFLDVEPSASAEMIRRFLRHRAFRTWARRKGTVLRVSEGGLRVWRLKAKKVELISW
jgi:hypothetical protein